MEKWLKPPSDSDTGQTDSDPQEKKTRSRAKRDGIFWPESGQGGQGSSGFQKPCGESSTPKKVENHCSYVFINAFNGNSSNSHYYFTQISP